MTGITSEWPCYNEAYRDSMHRLVTADSAGHIVRIVLCNIFAIFYIFESLEILLPSLIIRLLKYLHEALTLIPNVGYAASDRYARGGQGEVC